MNATQKRKIEQLVRTRAKQKLIELTEATLVQLNAIEPTTQPLPPKMQLLADEYLQLSKESAELMKRIRKIEDQFYKQGWRHSGGKWHKFDQENEGQELRNRIFRSTRTELTKWEEPSKQTPEPIRQLANHDAFHDGYGRQHWPGLPDIVENYVTKVDALNRFVEDTLLVQLYLEETGEETLQGLMETLDSLLK